MSKKSLEPSTDYGPCLDPTFRGLMLSNIGAARDEVELTLYLEGQRPDLLVFLTKEQALEYEAEVIRSWKAARSEVRLV
jgi:hypothetical protein